MSLPMRLFNVYVAPDEVFDYIAIARQSLANWIVPYALNCIVTIVFTWVAFSNPTVVQDMRDQQTRGMDAQVAAGKITAAQRDQAAAFMEKMAPFMTAIGVVTTVIGLAFYTLVAGGVVWLIGVKLLKATLELGKAMEIVGLAGFVGVLGTVIKLSLVIWKGSINAGTNLALFLPQSSAGTFLFTFLSLCDLFLWWQIALMAFGLGKAARCNWLKPLALLLLLWLLLSLGFAGLAGLGGSK